MNALSVSADIGPDQLLSVNLCTFNYSSILTCVLGAQKNPLNETVLLNTHNICFDREI